MPSPNPPGGPAVLADHRVLVGDHVHKVGLHVVDRDLAAAVLADQHGLLVVVEAGEALLEGNHA